MKEHITVSSVRDLTGEQFQHHQPVLRAMPSWATHVIAVRQDKGLATARKMAAVLSNQIQEATFTGDELGVHGCHRYVQHHYLFVKL